MAPIKFISVGALLSAAVGYFTTIYMGFASLSFSLLCIGIVFKQQRTMHVRLMNAGIFLDLGLVIFLEIQRSAINTATNFSLEPIQQIHILCSTLAVVLYFPTMILGWRIYLNKSQRRSLHLRFGIAAFVFRAIGFFLMFSMLSHVK